MKYENPVIRGFNPDPSICKAGDDFYLVTSSFEYFPVIPIYHSRDLVNWEQIGNAIGLEKNFDLSEASESGGVWAPTIRFDNGIFYITGAMQKLNGNRFGNFVIHTDDIRGEWSDPVWIPIGGIDPSLFFEEQKAYYCTNDNLGETLESIKLGVIDPVTGETKEAFRTIWHGTGGGWLEAPHIYHIGDWYYLMCAQGGTSFGHHEVIGRARDIWGPYEACPDNPILTNRHDTDKQASGCGHGDLMEDSFGNWWMIHLGHRSGKIALSPLGRETFLTPVVWENGWPVISGGKARLMEEGPLCAKQLPWSKLSDDFKDSAWPCWWYFVRNPDLSHFERGNGCLRMIPFGGKPTAEAMQGFVGTKQQDIVFQMQTKLFFVPKENGDAAGLMVYLTHEFYYFFGVRKRGEGTELFLERKMEDVDIISWQEGTDAANIGLMVEGTKEDYHFYVVAADGSKIRKCSASARFLSNGITGRGFTGTMTGLYVEKEQETGTEAEFTDFQIINIGV